MSEEIKQIAEDLKGKRPKVKSLDVDLQGTKTKKLPRDVKKGLEEHFGSKLDKFRIHFAGNAGDLCKEINAKAFTQGSDIVLRKPGDSADSKLLAHELTHVLNQSKGRVPKVQKGKVFVTK